MLAPFSSAIEPLVLAFVLSMMPNVGLTQQLSAILPCLVIATQNFEDPDVLVMMILANTIGIVLLMLVARLLRRANVADAAPV